MAERFTVPSSDRMEWLGEPGPSADNVHGHFTVCLSEPVHAATFAAASSPTTMFLLHGCFTLR